MSSFFKSPKIVLVAGFAMFSMFFGSGNLVFPLMVGMKSHDQFQIASIGLIISGVLLPFLGLIAMIYYGGNRAKFFKNLGAPAAFILTFSMLSLMGPFGVLPRCIIVAFGGFDLIFHDLTAPIFNAIFSVLTGLLAWHRTKIVSIIGTYLTPILIFGITAIIIMGVIAIETPPSIDISNTAAFMIGLDQGYQTMDLLAAFFFSATTVSYLASQINAKENPIRLERLSLVACSLGALMLVAVYLGFIYLGAAYAPLLESVAPEKLLVVVAQASLGPAALPVASVVICMACLTTSTILASLFADFLYNDIMQKRIPRSAALVVTLLIGYTVSLLGFMDLASWIANALLVAYPALIVFAVFKIISAKTGHKWSREAFWLVLLISILVRGLSAANIF